MPRKLGSSFQGLVNKWVNVNRENVVYSTEDGYRQQVIVLDDEPTTERPKSTLRKTKIDTKKTKSSGRRRHSQLNNDEPQHHDKLNAAPYHVYDDEKSVSSARTTLTASTHTTHSTLRSTGSVASAGSVPPCSQAPGDDESVSSFNKRLKLSNGIAAGLLPPPAVPGIYYDNDFTGRHPVASPPPPEHIPAIPEVVSSGNSERRPAGVPGVYFGVEYGGSAAPPAPSPAVEQLGAPAILPAPPGLVVQSSPMRHPGMPMASPPQMQMDHRVYYPPGEEPQAHHMQMQNHGPPPEIMAHQHPRRANTPASPQIISVQPPSHGIPSPARPVGPPPVMHFIHQHPPATPIPANSSNVQMGDQTQAMAGDSSEEEMNDDSHTEDEVDTPQDTGDKPTIQADMVQSSSSGTTPSVHFAPESDEAPTSPVSATSEIEAKMDAALVLSALSFTDQQQQQQGGPTPGKSEAKGKKGLLLRKARSPKEITRNSPSSMISWKAMRAARAADNES